jgi:hypothetical protein
MGLGGVRYRKQHELNIKCILTIETTEFNNQPEQSANKGMVTKAWLQKAVLELTSQFESY